VFLALCLLSIGCATRETPGPRAAADAGVGTPERPQFSILYFNDLHGHLVPFAREGDTTRVGGAARMATLVKQLRQENRLRGRPTLLLEGGDIFQGTVLSSVFKGEPDFKFLNTIQLDAMVLGNHEFDFGLDILRKRIAEARFPVLAANVRMKDGSLLTEPYAIQRLSNGVRVGILGLITDDTPETTDPINVEPLIFEPPLLTAAKYVPELEAKADILIALTHIGSEADVRLAKVYREIDVVVGGHDQVLIRRPLLEHETIIVQAQEHGLYLGRIDVEVDEDLDDVELVSDTIYTITGKIPEDPEVAALVASYTRRLDRELGRTIGRLTAPLEGDRHEIRKRPTNFGFLLTTLMRELTKADFAVLNSGGVRSSIDAGPVTMGEIVQALPFANRIMTVQLPGDAVRQLVERSLGAQKRSDGGGFLQVSGLSYDPGGSSGLSIEVNGKPITPDSLYTVAITDFLFNGGDGYDLFKRVGRNPRDTGILLAQALTEHIRKNSPFTPPDPSAEVRAQSAERRSAQREAVH
jgi:5'-nucleotidase/UDP-sugar diphosphatase